MGFERQPASSPERPTPGGIGALSAGEVARIEAEAAGPLGRFFEQNDFGAFEDFVAVTNQAMIEVVSSVAAELGWCLSLELPIFRLYEDYAVELSPRPRAVQHVLLDARERLRLIVGAMLDELAGLEIEPAHDGREARVAGELPEALAAIPDELHRVVHVCLARLDAASRRVLRATRTLSLPHDQAAMQLNMSEEQVRELDVAARELLDSSVRIAEGGAQ